MCRTDEIISLKINRKSLIENDDHEVIYSRVLTIVLVVKLGTRIPELHLLFYVQHRTFLIEDRHIPRCELWKHRE